MDTNTTQGDGDEIRAQRGPKKFEAHWLKEETVEAIVRTAWERAVQQGEGTTFMQKHTMFIWSYMCGTKMLLKLQLSG